MNTDDDGRRRWRSTVTTTRLAPGAAAALILVPLLVFGVLAVEVARQGSFAFDRTVMLWVHGATTPWLTDAATFASLLGGKGVPVAAALTALVLCIRRRWVDAGFVLAAYFAASRINVALKALFERTRPDFWEHLSAENTFSFPSGHAMGSMSIAAPLVVLTWGTRYRWPVLVAAAFYVLAVGASRVYLGVHFPSDVIAGWCVTVAVVAVFVLILQAASQRIRRRAPALSN